MSTFRPASLLGISACMLLVACIGASQSGDNTPRAPPGYFINQTLLGQYGIPRTIKAAGTDSAGRHWTFTWTSERALSACQHGGNADRVSHSRHLERDGILVTASEYAECWLHDPFQLTNLWYESGPDAGYSWQLSESGNLSTTEEAGARGTLGQWFLFDDRLSYSGYIAGSWSVEDQDGRAVLILVHDRYDPSGVFVAREVQRFVMARKEDSTGKISSFSTDLPLPSGETIHLRTGS